MPLAAVMVWVFVGMLTGVFWREIFGLVYGLFHGR